MSRQQYPSTTTISSLSISEYPSIFLNAIIYYFQSLIDPDFIESQKNNHSNRYSTYGNRPQNSNRPPKMGEIPIPPKSSG